LKTTSTPRIRPPLSGAPDIWLLSERLSASGRSDRLTAANATQAATLLTGWPAQRINIGFCPPRATGVAKR
jgi:hypothetical protein